MTQDEKLDLLLEKFGGLEGRFDKLEGRFDVLEGRFDKLEGGVNALNKKSDSYHRELKGMDKAILDEVERVHNILMRHMSDGKVHTA